MLAMKGSRLVTCSFLAVLALAWVLSPPNVDPDAFAKEGFEVMHFALDMDKCRDMTDAVKLSRPFDGRIFLTEEEYRGGA